MPDATLFSQLLTTESLIALGTLTLLEIVLGIDNLVVLSIVTAKLRKEEQPKARRLGLLLAAEGLRMPGCHSPAARHLTL